MRRVLGEATCTAGKASTSQRCQSRALAPARPQRRTQCRAYSGKSSEGSDHHQSGRRELLLASVNFGLLWPIAGMVVGTDDTTTIVNSVLSAYGLPTFKSNDTLRLYDEFENDWVFAYPRSWVARPNTLRKGFYVSNFQTADKATVEEFPLPIGWGSASEEERDEELIKQAVIAAVVPGASAGQADDKLSTPPRKLIKSEARVVDGKRYIYLAFPSETVTRSGYNIKRKHFAVVGVAESRGLAYTLSASARSDQYNKDKAQLLQEMVDSFRIR